MMMGFSRSHEWARSEGQDLVTVGISRHAAEEVGEIAQVALPQPGERLVAGAVLAEVEAVKSIIELVCPVDGVVERVNQALLDDPNLIGRDPEGAGWLVELRCPRDLDAFGLLSPEAYRAQTGQQA
jgi:glycine cleavage system H protein